MLSDLGFVQNSLIFLEEALDLKKLKGHEKAGDSNMTNIHAVLDKTSLTVVVDKNESLYNLLVEIKMAHNLSMDAEYRLYDVMAKKYFSLEEMSKPLKSFQGNSNFKKGGKTINIELG